MTSRRAVAVVLVVLGVIWLRVDGPFEGPILITFTIDHGLTLADLLSLVAFAVAACLWVTRSGVRPRR